MNWKTLALIFAAGLLLRRSRKNRYMLSKNFALEEFTKSNTAKRLGIDNTPGPIEIANIGALVINVLQPLRDAMGFPIIITSGYRSQALNEQISNAASDSQHTKGEAADIVGQDKAKMFYYIKDNLPFDQLIWEAGNSNEPQWIHVSYKAIGNRKQVLRYTPGAGYSTF